MLYLTEISRDLSLRRHSYEKRGNIKPKWNDIAFFAGGEIPPPTILLLRRPCHGKRDRVEHVFKEDAVPRGRIIDEHVGDGSHELAVLDDGAA